ncbi:MAG: presenilin family intramembrane aspartyl protease [Candidatus Nanoarchaeia archaeon]
MKHNIKITIILLSMFILTQFIGLYVVNHYSSTKLINGEVVNVTAPALPFGLETPEEADVQCEINSLLDFFKCTEYLYSIIIAFIFAVALLFFLTKFNAEFILKLWFFIVVIIALGITLNALIPEFSYSILVVLIVVIPLAYIKIYKKEFLVHNITELFIYPGIAAVFVPIINIWIIVILLILISIYDMWAVWHSGIMQKMAKYQIQKLNIFSGFFVPYISKRQRQKLKKLTPSKRKKTKVKANVAILGGGDVIFPIITAGVMLKTFGMIPALFVILGATLGLSYLFFAAEKKKFYPAMPFISAGIFAGMLVSYIIF